MRRLVAIPTRNPIRIVVFLAFALLVIPLVTDAERSTKVHRIGWLRLGRPPVRPNPSVEAFQKSLRDLGYIEGQNLIIEYRYAKGDAKRLTDLALELIRLNVDVLVTSGTPATLAAKRATRTIPIIMTGIGVDPVESGLVSSLARPKENVTGIAALGAELWGKRLELFKEAVPKLSRLAVLWYPANPINTLCLRAIETVAQIMDLKVHPLEVQNANAFERAFTKIAEKNPDALLICWSSLTRAHAKPIADFAVRNRLPTLAAIKAYVQAGALMSYGTNIPAQYQRAAHYVDKLLKGRTPADLPVERPMHFDLVINLKTAEAIGLTIPPMLRFQAHEVIK